MDALTASVAEGDGERRKLYLYTFGVDTGSVETGMLRRVKTAVAENDYVMMIGVLCLFHTAHRISKSVFAFTDTYEWPDAETPYNP